MLQLTATSAEYSQFPIRIAGGQVDLPKKHSNFFFWVYYSIACMMVRLYKWHIYTAGFWEFFQFDTHNQ